MGAATRLVGDNRRSAFYKYKDSAQPFSDMKSEHIITFYLPCQEHLRCAEPGAVGIRHLRSQYLTINQSIPTNGCAAVIDFGRTLWRWRSHWSSCSLMWAAWTGAW